MRRFGLSVLVLLGLLWGQLGSASEFTTLKGHGGPVMDIDVSAQGQIATASFDNALGLWAGRVPRWLDGHEAAVNVVRFIGADTLASGGDDFTVRLWQAGRGRILGRHRGKVTALALAPDGARLASASWDGRIGLWPLAGGNPTWLSLRDSGANDLAFSANGARLFVATTKGAIEVFDLTQSGVPQPLVKHGFGVNKLLLGPQDAWLAYGAVDGGTRVIDPATGAPLADFTLDRKPILALRHHAGTQRLAVGDGHGFIMLVDTERWRITKDFRATRQGPIWALAFSGDGAMLYAAGLDDVVYGWPVDLMDQFDPAPGGARSYLRAADQMPNGERQFMRKCSICHALDPGPSRKAGPSLHGIFGRPAGSLAGYSYSQALSGSQIIWDAHSIDQLFDLGPDHYIPGSKMPMQVIADPQDRRDLLEFLDNRTQP